MLSEVSLLVPNLSWMCRFSWNIPLKSLHKIICNFFLKSVDSIRYERPELVHMLLGDHDDAMDKKRLRGIFLK